MLGNSDSEFYFPEYELVYWLGPEGGIMGIDSEWLAIDLDENGNLLSTNIVTD